jgi:hypothetical protein
MEQVAAFARDVAISLIPLRNGSVRLSLSKSVSVVRASCAFECYKYDLCWERLFHSLFPLRGNFEQMPLQNAQRPQR